TLKPDAPPERRVNGEAALREAQARIETIRLSVNVPGAEVRVDGRAVGKAPLLDPVFVDPGPHTVEALLEGVPTARATGQAKAGGARELVLELKKDEVEAKPPGDTSTSPPRALTSVVPERRSVVPGAVLGGAAGAALIVGVALVVEGAVKRGQAHDLYQSIT